MGDRNGDEGLVPANDAEGQSNQTQSEKAQMPRPCAVVVHALGYIETITASQKMPWACSVEFHAPRGTAPGVTIHRASLWHSEV
jgi:hypothetical protein